MFCGCCHAWILYAQICLMCGKDFDSEQSSCCLVCLMNLIICGRTFQAVIQVQTESLSPLQRHLNPIDILQVKWRWNTTQSKRCCFTDPISHWTAFCTLVKYWTHPWLFVCCCFLDMEPVASCWKILESRYWMLWWLYMVLFTRCL